MSRREELLNGVTSLNRREFDAREDSEMPPTFSGESMESRPARRDDTIPGDAGDGLPTDTGNIQATETSLEDILRAEVTRRSEELRQVRLEISTAKLRLENLTKTKLVLEEKVEIAVLLEQQLLEKSYAMYPGGNDGPEGTVQVEDETSETTTTEEVE